jgi:ABC-type sugar transport system substrate-binding protein
MRPGDLQQTPTLSEAANRAVDLVDPEGANDAVADLFTRFEDRDEPISQIQTTIEQEVAEVVGAIDPDEIDPAVQMAGAVITYLAFRRDEISDVREDVLRLAARAEFDGDPPPAIREWLESEGVEV